MPRVRPEEARGESKVMVRVTKEELDALTARIAAARCSQQIPPAETLKRWSNAKPTQVGDITFPSKMEARVYERLLRELTPGERLYRQVRVPLLASAPDDSGKPLNITVDFVIVTKNNTLRWIDAKGKRQSRDWRRGKAAFEAQYGPLEEVTE